MCLSLRADEREMMKRTGTLVRHACQLGTQCRGRLPSKETLQQTQVYSKLTEVTTIGGSYGATSKLLTVDHYQKLIDRGWRRYVQLLSQYTDSKRRLESASPKNCDTDPLSSGTYLYKPDTKRSCCPSHTIR